MRPICSIRRYWMTAISMSGSSALIWDLPCFPSCDGLGAFGNHISIGMYAEIDEAKRLGIPVQRIKGFELTEKEVSVVTRHPLCSMRL